jgi:hypothetical protein
MWDRLCRQADFEEGGGEPKQLENFKMGKSQMKKLLGKGVQFKDEESAREYAEGLANQGYKVYWGKRKGGKKWLVFKLD